MLSWLVLKYASSFGVKLDGGIWVGKGSVDRPNRRVWLGENMEEERVDLAASLRSKPKYHLFVRPPIFASKFVMSSHGLRSLETVSSDIDEKEFFKKYVATRTPVIVNGLLDDADFVAQKWVRSMPNALP